MSGSEKAAMIVGAIFGAMAGAGIVLALADRAYSNGMAKQREITCEIATCVGAGFGVMRDGVCYCLEEADR